MPPTAFQDVARQITDEVGKVIVGQRELIEEILVAFLAGGHVLLEGVPGLGKTRLVHAFSQALDLEFSRIQFTPDLMPADITGTSILKESAGGGREFAFQRGPLFANIVLADEINRATPKTQSALLEAMQEGTVSVLTNVHRLPRPFAVLATQNPLEMEGTYPLPEAQLDRFVLRTAFGYPARDDEVDVLGRRVERRTDEVDLNTVVDRETFLDMQRALERVHVAESVRGYCVDIAAATRESQSIAVGASPRGSLALMKLARCRAALAARDFVVPDDVKAVAPAALAHRLVLRPELWVRRVSAEDVVRELLAGVPTPRAEDISAAR
jgi:MoxR-like ATPase